MPLYREFDLNSEWISLKFIEIYYEFRLNSLYRRIYAHFFMLGLAIFTDFLCVEYASFKISLCFEWLILNTQKVWSSNKFKKMKSLCNRRVSVWNPDTLKEIVHFIHEVHPPFAGTLSTFLHMLCGWNDDTMPTFNLFRVHLKCFSILGSYSSK